MRRFDEWEAALEAWLASLPKESPVHRLDDIDKCAAFSKWEESQK